MHRPRCVIAVVVTCVASLAPVVAGTVDELASPSSPPPDGRRGAAVTLDGYFPWAPPELGSWPERAERVRRQILVAAGLWPEPPKTELASVVHGAIERDGYTVSKVFFQSHPGLFVTGNLYVPTSGEGPFPAVLSPHGHWANGRLHERSEAEARQQVEAGKELDIASARYHIQARCAMLARLGCVVLQYDMVGVADSRQLPHGGGFGDVEAELRLQSAFGVQTWNTIRALDFLCSLPQVDPARIGVTGASGGGTQTFILCAVDERPAAAFPAVMVSTSMQGGCVCENASHLRVGTGNVEFAALAAPRPYALTGADDWTREILTKGFPELRGLWSRLGAGENVAAWCYPMFEHNYNRVSREHMYDWFNRHLGLGGEEPVRERPFEPIAPADLRVFDDAHPLPESAVDLAGLRAWLTRTSDRQLAELAPRSAAGLERFRNVVGAGLEAILHVSRPTTPATAAVEGRVELSGATVERILVRRPGAVAVTPALRIRPASPNGRVVVVVDAVGKRRAALEPPTGDVRGFTPLVRGLLERRATVIVPDLWLTGEHLVGGPAADGPVGPEDPRFGKDGSRHGRYVGYTYGYNRTLLAERVHDLLAVLEVAGRPEQVGLVGVGRAATWALLARAVRPSGAAGPTALDGTGIVDWSAMDRLDHPEFLPGALKYGGAPAFLALSAPRRVLVVGGEEPGRVPRAAWASVGAAASLGHREAGSLADSTVLDWMSASQRP